MARVEGATATAIAEGEGFAVDHTFFAFFFSLLGSDPDSIASKAFFFAAVWAVTLGSIVGGRAFFELDLCSPDLLHRKQKSSIHPR